MVTALQIRKTQLSRLQDSQQIRTACLLPFDFTRLVDGISSGMFTELDDIQEQIESACRDAAEKLAQDLGTGAPPPCLRPDFCVRSAPLPPWTALVIPAEAVQPRANPVGLLAMKQRTHTELST